MNYEECDLVIDITIKPIKPVEFIYIPITIGSKEDNMDTYMNVLKSPGTSDAGQVTKAGKWAVDEIARLKDELLEEKQERENLYTIFVEHCENEERLQTENEVLRTALKRLASVEAFRMSGIMDAEAKARIQFARNVLEGMDSL